MVSQPYKDDTFVKLFDVADKMRLLVLQTSTNKKTQALMESLTYRQHKALVAVTLLTEKNPVGITLKKLAERLNMTVPATSVLVESMVQNKIFIRVTSQTDRRAVCIKLSDLGMSLMETIRQKMTDFIHNIYLEISEDEKDVFRRVITQLHQRLFPENEIQKEN